MSIFDSKRTLSSLKMTKGYTSRFLGLWVLLTILLVALLNGGGYLLVQAYWGSEPLIRGIDDEFVFLRGGFAVILTIEFICLVLAILGFAVTTAHRIAGPYVRLKYTFAAVRDGDMDHRLKFRDYDGLEGIAQGFNEMMDVLQARIPPIEPTGDSAPEAETKEP